MLAAAPVLLLTVMVLRSQPLTRTAWLVAGVAAVIAMTSFGLDVPEVVTALTRGLWTGGWILLIVLPALLLYEVLERSGALDHLAMAADRDECPDAGSAGIAPVAAIGDTDAANREREQATPTFEELGARPDLDAASAPEHVAARAAPGGLTTREVEVLRWWLTAPPTPRSLTSSRSASGPSSGTSPTSS